MHCLYPGFEINDSTFMYRLFQNTSLQVISHASSTSYDNRARGWKNELIFRKAQEMCNFVFPTASILNLEPKLPCCQQLQGALYPRENSPKGKSVHSPSYSQNFKINSPNFFYNVTVWYLSESMEFTRSN